MNYKLLLGFHELISNESVKVFGQILIQKNKDDSFSFIHQQQEKNPFIINFLVGLSEQMNIVENSNIKLLLDKKDFTINNNYELFFDSENKLNPSNANPNHFFFGYAEDINLDEHEYFILNFNYLQATSTENDGIEFLDVFTLQKDNKKVSIVPLNTAEITEQQSLLDFINSDAFEDDFRFFFNSISSVVLNQFILHESKG